MGIDNLVRKITPNPGEDLTQEKALEATKRLQKDEGKETTLGQLRFELDNIKAKIISLRNERAKERMNIVNMKGVDILEKSASLRYFDEETAEKLKPLAEERDKIETSLGGGHA